MAASQRHLFTLLLCALCLAASAQEGFTSIDCGATGGFISLRNISWLSDDNFVSSGSSAKIKDESNSNTILQTLRYFPNTTSSANCYYLPVKSNRTYLVRALYYYGNYDGRSMWPVFSSYVDGFLWVKVAGRISEEQHGYYHLIETILSPSASSLSFCFSSSDDQNVPFVSGLETRLLPSGSYPIPSSSYFYTLMRANLGSPIFLRYPDDLYDRYWLPLESTRMINTSQSVSTAGLIDQPPQKMFMTADEGPPDLTHLYYNWSFDSNVSHVHVKLYFWDFRRRAPEASCIFHLSISIDNEVRNDLNHTFVLDTKPISHAIDITNLSTSFMLGISLSPLANSTLPPILNGIEVYGVKNQIPQPKATYTPSTATRCTQMFLIWVFILLISG